MIKLSGKEPVASELLKSCKITGLTVENTSFSSLLGMVSQMQEEELETVLSNIEILMG